MVRVLWKVLIGRQLKPLSQHELSRELVASHNLESSAIESNLSTNQQVLGQQFCAIFLCNPAEQNDVQSSFANSQSCGTVTKGKDPRYLTKGLRDPQDEPKGDVNQPKLL